MNRNFQKKKEKKSNSGDNSENNLDQYENALLNSLLEMDVQSNKKDNSKTDDNTPHNNLTDIRIDFVKNLASSHKLKPLVDFDACNTETATAAKVSKKILDVKDVFSEMNVKLNYLKSGTTGHAFKAVSKQDKNIIFVVKVCAYPKDEYGAITNAARPENVELRMLKLLSYFVVNKISPHFVLPITTFNTSIRHFVNAEKVAINIDDEKNEQYKKFVEKYKNGELDDFVSVLVGEWCDGGDLLDYIRKNYRTMTLKQWTIIFFQILYTLSVVHEKYPAFKHNDMKANNILVQYTPQSNNPNGSGVYYGYKLENCQFLVPNIGMQIKIWDFDFACIQGVIENNKVNADWARKMNITSKPNKYYDIHFFFNTLISTRFFPQFYEEGCVPQQIIDFVHRVIPEKFRGSNTDYTLKKGRIKINDEYTTPLKLITTDPLFAKYRHAIQQ